MRMRGDIFAAALLWRGSLLTTGHLSSRHPVVVGAGDVAWRDLSSCCAALQQLWGTRSCGKTDRISELEPITSVRGAHHHHTSSAADAPPCKVGERKHRNVLRYCAALQQLWGTRNCGKLLCGRHSA